MKGKLVSLAVCTCLTASCCMGMAFASESVITDLTESPVSYLTESVYVDDCELGCVIADSIRTYAGTDVALVEMGVIANDLNQGEVTEEDIENVFSEDLSLAVATVTPAELCALLEQSVSLIEVDPDTEQLTEAGEGYEGFCQVSGLTFRYDASAPEGERILSIKLDDGTSLDLEDTETTLTLAATDALLSGEYGYTAVSSESLGATLTDALESYLSTRTAVPEEDTDRITVIGARQNTIVGLFPDYTLTIGMIVLIVIAACFGTKMHRHEDSYETANERLKNSAD